MNADRAQLSFAVLVSIAVHGFIASFGGFPAGQAARATGDRPVTVTIASMMEAETQQSELRLQESKTEVAKPAKKEELVPANAIPDQRPQTQSPEPEALSSTEAKDTTPAPKSEPDQPRLVEAVVPTSAEQSPDTTLADVLAGNGHTDATTRLSVPENPDVTAVPIYHLIPKPAYPGRSRDLGEEGRVIIAVLVSEDGSVLQAYVSESSGYPLLDGSALATVTERWRFKPGTRRGKAVSSWVRVPIQFSIKGS